MQEADPSQSACRKTRNRGLPSQLPMRNPPPTRARAEVLVTDCHRREDWAEEVELMPARSSCKARWTMVSYIALVRGARLSKVCRSSWREAARQP